MVVKRVKIDGKRKIIVPPLDAGPAAGGKATGGKTIKGKRKARRGSSAKSG